MTTKECNLRCKYCYEKNKTARRMSIETAKDVIDFLFSDKYHKKYDNIQLGLIGGEVFENLSTLNFILFYALKKMELTKKWNKLQFHICTNGTFFSNKKVQELILRYNKWLYLSVSLDGCKTIHDMNRCNSYDTIMACVLFWKKIKHNIGIKMTITYNSLPLLYESIKSIIDLNAKSILLTFVKENVWQANDGEIVYNQLKLIADYIIDNNLWTSKNADINFFDYRFILNSDEKHLPNCRSGERCCELVIDCDGNVFNCFTFAICDNYLE